MPSHDAHGFSQPSQGNLLFRAIKNDWIAGELWRFAADLTEQGLLDQAAELRAESRAARVAAMQCRARAGLFSVLS